MGLLNRGPKPVKAICGCTHHYSFHNPETGRCHHVQVITGQRQELVRDADGNVVLDLAGRVQKMTILVEMTRVECGCQHYVGPQPLPTVYAEELTR